MGDLLSLAQRVGLIGIGATLLLDIWSYALKAFFGVPFPNYTMVGRWIGHFPRGRFVHESIARAPAVAGERLIGWTAHYAIGVLYSGIFIAITGCAWVNAPTVLPALIFGVATLVAPFLMMQPGMGLGIASSKAPNPNLARLRSLAAHFVFGLGLYLLAFVAALLWSPQA